MFGGPLFGGAAAEQLYQKTDYAGALALLHQTRQMDAATLALAGKCSLMLGDYGKAIEYFAKAVALEPGSSEYVLWLGRAWGRKAEKGNPLTAMAAASHARESFEKAVALEPESKAATGDLFDYYLDAPAMFGGGLDKAEKLAERVEQFDPPEGRSDRGRIAVKRKQYSEAERFFRAALSMRPEAVGYAVQLARFLAQQGRLKESDEVLAKAPAGPRLWFGRASIDIEMHRNPEEARGLLERYVGADLTPDDPPRDEALRLLAKTK